MEPLWNPSYVLFRFRPFDPLPDYPSAPPSGTHLMLSLSLFKELIESGSGLFEET